MTPADIAAVRRTFAAVAPIADTAADLFYGRLFETAPAVRPMFRGDMREQGRKLMATIGLVVAALDRLDDILPAVRRLAVKHVDYGVTPDLYAVVGAALLWTLEQGLGDAFTDEVRAGWTAAYTLLSDAMIAAAYPAAA